jgi:Cu2+-exporting ATPase
MVAAEASGQDTIIADVVRMVEAAQARTAPIQRLADSVAGKFAYGVMGLSAATFTFWSTVGARMFPQVLAAATAGAAAAGGAGAAAAGACCCPPASGTAAAAAAAATGGMAAAGSAAAAVPAAAAVLLGLQLACNVLVVACPCALGLATPTAVLVGTAAGARKGLLVRGGDILEATSQVGGALAEA